MAAQNRAGIEVDLEDEGELSLSSPQSASDESIEEFLPGAQPQQVPKQLSGPRLLEFLEKGIADYRNRTTGKQPMRSTRSVEKRVVAAQQKMEGIEKQRLEKKLNAERNIHKKQPIAARSSTAKEEKGKKSSKKEAPSVDAGNRLYELARLSAKRIDERRSLAHLKREKKETDGCTFKPVICSKSVEVIGPRYQSPADRFCAEELRLARRRHIERHLDAASTMQECSFKPVIEPISVVLTNAKRARASSAQRCDSGLRLFIDGKDRRERQEQQLQLLDRELKQEMVGGGKNLPKEKVQSMLNRFEVWEKRRETLLENVREEMEDVHRIRIPSSQGKELLDRLAACPPPPPPLDRKASSQRSHSAPRERHTESPVEPQLTFQPQLNPISARLASGLKEVRYRSLFNRYASSELGTVSMQQLKDQVKTLFPQDVGMLAAFRRFPPTEILDLDKFVTSLELFERIHGPQSWGRSTAPSADLALRAANVNVTGKPKLSNRSEELAKTRQRPRSIHLSLYSEAKEKADQIAELSSKNEQQRAEKEAKECTFRPNVATNRASNTSTLSAARTNRFHQHPQVHHEEQTSNAGDAQPQQEDLVVTLENRLKELERQRRQEHEALKQNNSVCSGEKGAQQNPPQNEATPHRQPQHQMDSTFMASAERTFTAVYRDV